MRVTQVQKTGDTESGFEIVVSFDDGHDVVYSLTRDDVVAAGFRRDAVLLQWLKNPPPRLQEPDEWRDDEET